MLLTKASWQAGLLLILFGLETALMPEPFINNQITHLMYDHVPREVHGSLQLTAGLLILMEGGGLSRMARNTFAALMIGSWSLIMMLPLFLGEPTNVVMMTGFGFWSYLTFKDGLNSMYHVNYVACHPEMMTEYERDHCKPHRQRKQSLAA